MRTFEDGFLGYGIKGLSRLGFHDVSGSECAEGGEDEEVFRQQKAGQSGCTSGTWDSTQRMQMPGDGGLSRDGLGGIMDKLDGRPSEPVNHRQQLVPSLIVIAANQDNVGVQRVTKRGQRIMQGGAEGDAAVVEITNDGKVFHFIPFDQAGDAIEVGL